MDGIADEVLVARSIEGDPAAFEMLVARYQTLVCSVAYAVTGDFARSEDVGQESLVQAWKQLDQLKDGAKFKSWVCAIARNVAHTANRNFSKSRLREVPESLQDPSASIEDRAMQNEEETLVWETLQQLPMNYREPLILFYRQEHSIAEVAESLDVSTDVVKQRLSRGRNLLREEVTAIIERTLRNTIPSRAFTTAVLASITVLGSSSATAATAGSVVTAATAKHVAGAGGLKLTAAFGAIFGPLIGIAGGVFGAWCSWSTARYQSQRDLIIRLCVVYLIGIAIFSLPYLAMLIGWQPWAVFGQRTYVVMHLSWMGLAMLANAVWIYVGIRSHQELVRREKQNETPELPETAPQRLLNQYEGRRWTSNQKLFGAPWVDIAFSDPGDADLAVNGRIARGWIAIGDRAVGRLLAIGNIARAPIAIGTRSIGLFSIGVFSVGVVSVGVVSVGGLAAGIFAASILSIGIVSLGYLSTGVVAIGWKAAKGVVAFAYHFSDGVASFGNHAGDEAAKEWIAQSTFVQFGESLIRQSGNWFVFPLVALLVAAILILARLAYRRKPVDGANG